MITRDQIDIADKEVMDAWGAYREADSRLSELKNAYAEQVCPLKIGAEVPIVGHSYFGKKMKVTRIMAPSHRFQGDWAVSGTLILKSGKLGCTSVSFCQKHYDMEQKK